MRPISTVAVFAGLLLSCSIAAAAEPTSPAAGDPSTKLPALVPSCLAIEDMREFAELRPLKGLIPMTMAELKNPTWKMLHTSRVPTEEEKAALRVYGLKSAGCVKTHLEFCKLMTEGVHKVVCGAPELIDLQANDLLKVLVSGGGTFDSYTGAVIVLAAARAAADTRALALERTLQAEQK